MSEFMQGKAIKELLKSIIDSNTSIPSKAKIGLKTIIECEDDPEKLLQKCLMYMFSYGQ